MANKVNFYEVLEIEPSATLDEVKKAYRTLALKWHPDKNSDPEAEENFKKIGRAYNTLSDGYKRSQYDRQLNYSDRDSYDSYDDEEDVTLDFFLNLFAAGFSRHQASHSHSHPCFGGFESGSGRIFFVHLNRRPTEPPKPIEKEVPLTIFEVFEGCKKQVKIERKERCPGDGIVRPRYKKFDLTVMPGVKTGTRVTFKQEGDQIPGEIPQDVIFIFNDIPNKHFVRDGSNVKRKVSITKDMAKNGGQVEIKLLDRSSTRIDIDPNTTDDSVKCFKGLGLPIPRKPKKRGDLLIIFSIKQAGDTDINQNQKKKGKKSKKGKK